MAASGVAREEIHAQLVIRKAEMPVAMEQKIVAEYAAGTANTHAHQH